jgi:hypothetical protein
MRLGAFAADVQVRLHIRHDPHGAPIFLMVSARPPTEPVRESLIHASKLSAPLTCALGATWPYERGEAVAHATLQECGVAVTLSSHALAGAMARRQTCRRRIAGGGA